MMLSLPNEHLFFLLSLNQTAISCGQGTSLDRLPWFLVALACGWLLWLWMAAMLAADGG